MADGESELRSPNGDQDTDPNPSSTEPGESGSEDEGGADAPADGASRRSAGRSTSAPPTRLRLVGLGLICSLIIGYPPLRDAVQGNGSFESAMFRFLACFAACVFAASLLGRMLDNAPPPQRRKTVEPSIGSGVGPSPAGLESGSSGAIDGQTESED